MHVHQKGFGIVEIVLIIVVVGLLGTLGWLVYSRQTSNTENTTQTSQPEQEVQPQQEGPEQQTPQPEVTLDYDKIYAEVAATFTLAKDKLRVFWIYAADKVVFANKDEGPGLVYAYKTGGTWKIASNAIQYQAVCSEIDKLQQEYRPPCNATEGLAVASRGDLTFKYVSDQTVWTAAEQLEKSTNYPAATRHKYIGDSAN